MFPYRRRRKGGFNPASIVDGNGNKLLKQQLFTSTAMSGSTIFDERTNKGDARDIQLRYVNHLDGTTQYGLVLDDATLDITNNLTVIVVAKNDKSSLDTPESMVAKYDQGNNRRTWEILQTATQTFGLNLGTADGTFAGRWESDTAVAVEDKGFYAATFDSGVVKLNYQGSEVAGSATTGTIPSVINTETTPLTIGSALNNNAYAKGFDGIIYELIIIRGDSAPLTQAQIADVYDSISAIPTKDIQDTVYGLTGQDVRGHYELATNTGSGIFDSSGKGNHGTWQNSPTIEITDEDVISYQNEVGFSQRTYFDGVDDVVVLPTSIRTQFGGKGKIEFAAKIYIPQYPTITTTSIFAVPINDGSSGFRFGVDTGGNLNIGGRRVTSDTFAQFTIPISLGKHDVRAYLDYQNQEYGLKIDDAEWVTGATSFASGAGNYTVGTLSSIGATFGSVNGVANTFWLGTISDCELLYDDVLASTWSGYDATVAGWADALGSNSATSLTGSPANISIPRNEATPTEDVFGNPLQFTGEVPYNALAKQSNCIDLNGTNQYISVLDNADLDITDNLSVVIRAKSDLAELSADSTLIGKWLGTGDEREWILLYNDTDEKLRLSLGNPSTGVGQCEYDSDAAVDIENANSVGFTFSAGTIQLYVNGVAITGSVTTGSIPSTLYNGTANLNIGATNEGAAAFFNGQLYDARIYKDTILTAAEMLAIHNGTEGEVSATRAAHYPIANGEGSRTPDVSGNGNHGTLMNSPTWSKQDVYHYNLKYGCNRYMWFDGVNDKLTVSGLGAYSGYDEGSLEIKFSTLSDTNTFFSVSGAGANNYFVFGLDSSGRANLQFRGLSSAPALDFNEKRGSTALNDGNPHTIKWSFDGSSYALEVDGVVEAITTESGSDNAWFGDLNTSQTQVTSIGAFTTTSTSRYTEGLIYDIIATNSSDVKIHEWNLRGVDDITDKVGSFNLSAVGSPVNYYAPAVSETLDVYGSTILGTGNIYNKKRNWAETEIDFTGGVASPVAVQLGWVDDWAFNDAETNPRFHRDVTVDTVEAQADRFLAYSETLSGTNLTKVNKYTEDITL